MSSSGLVGSCGCHHAGIVGYYLVGFITKGVVISMFTSSLLVTQVYFAVAHFNELRCGQFVIGIDGAVDVAAIFYGIASSSTTGAPKNPVGEWIPARQLAGCPVR